MREIGVWDFLSGQLWRPANNIFGILPMIMGSIYVTAGAIVVGVPIGLFTAVFMAHYCPKRIYGICKTAVNPDGGRAFRCIWILRPGMYCSADAGYYGRDGSTMLTASILLGIMILPTIVSVCEASIRSVPVPYYEGALALGATKERSIFATVLPAAKSGIVAGIVLGDRTRYRRDHGGGYGSRKSGLDAAGAVERRTDDDIQHRVGNGLCCRPSQRSS